MMWSGVAASENWWDLISHQSSLLSTLPHPPSLARSFIRNFLGENLTIPNMLLDWVSEGGWRIVWWSETEWDGVEGSETEWRLMATYWPSIPTPSHPISFWFTPDHSVCSTLQMLEFIHFHFIPLHPIPSHPILLPCQGPPEWNWVRLDEWQWDLIQVFQTPYSCAIWWFFFRGSLQNKRHIHIKIIQNRIELGLQWS